MIAYTIGKNVPIQLTSIKLNPASHYIEPSQLYEDGKLVEYGGYEKEYKSIFTPLVMNSPDITKPLKAHLIRQGTNFCWQNYFTLLLEPF